MRAHLTALLVCLAVFFTVGTAWADDAAGCVNWAPQGSFAVQADVEAATQTYTRLGEVFWRETPGQSRAPVVCADPNDPRCHIDQSEAPSHPRSLAISGDGVTVPSLDIDVPPPAEVDFDHATTLASGPLDAHTHDLLRPPAR